VPLDQSSGSVLLEVILIGEAAILIEVVENGGVNGGEFLQTSHSAKALHRPFSSSKRQLGILRSVVQPAADFLPVDTTDLFQSRAVRAQLVRDDNLGGTVLMHCFPKEFQRCPIFSGLRHETLE
jgi:hypothetical protein